MVVAPSSVSSRPVRLLVLLGRSRPGVLDIDGAEVFGDNMPPDLRKYLVGRVGLEPTTQGL
jgi:hypothetical protein